MPKQAVIMFEPNRDVRKLKMDEFYGCVHEVKKYLGAWYILPQALYRLAGKGNYLVINSWNAIPHINPSHPLSDKEIEKLTDVNAIAEKAVVADLAKVESDKKNNMLTAAIMIAGATVGGSFMLMVVILLWRKTHGG
jgi:hypothetical protein